MPTETSIPTADRFNVSGIPGYNEAILEAEEAAIASRRGNHVSTAEMLPEDIPAAIDAQAMLAVSPATVTE